MPRGILLTKGIKSKSIFKDLLTINTKDIFSKILNLFDIDR